MLADDLVKYIQRLPGTEAAATAECTPLSGGAVYVTFRRSDRPLPEAFHRGDGIGVCGAGPDYFKAAGTRLVRGRFLTERDFARPGTLALVNETAARVYFPGEDPLGKQIGGGRVERWKTVVGVVADSKNQGLDQPPMPQMFVNDLAVYPGSDLNFVVRNIGSEQALASEVRAKLRSIDPGLFAKFESLDETMSQMTSAPRFNSILLASFAAVAFLMAVVGVYGVLAYAVTERTQEIGMRVALGAEPRRVLGLVMREGAVLASTGIISGLCATLVLTRYLKALLYGISATDPMTYMAVVFGLSAAATAAMWIPARRAASVDPMLALRHE